MKVLFVSEQYPPVDGGVATSTQRIARQLVQLGLIVTVFTFDGSRHPKEQDYKITKNDDGVAVIRFGPFFTKNVHISRENLPPKFKASLRRRVYDQMVKQAVKEQPDIILSFYLLNAGWLAQYLGNQLNIPVVAGIRGNDIGRNIFYPERFAVTPWVTSNATKLVCVNNHLKNRLSTALSRSGNPLYHGNR